MGPSSLAETINKELDDPRDFLTEEEAKKAISNFMATYKGVSRYIEKYKDIAREVGVVKTLTGRARPLPAAMVKAPWKIADPKERKKAIEEKGHAERAAVNCFDEETEVLSQRGWLSYKNLTASDVLATITGEGVLEWDTLIAVSMFPGYDEPCIEFSHPEISALTTKNHRWLVYDRVEAKNFFVTTENLCARHEILKTATNPQKEAGISDMELLKHPLSLEFLLNLSQRQCRLLLETLIGTGSTSISPDLYQILCFLSGKSYELSFRNLSSYAGYTPGKDRVYLLPEHKKEKTVSFVWCPTVKNGTVVVRRKGTVYITGQSPIQGCLPSSARILTLEGYKTIDNLIKSYPGERLQVWTGFNWKPAKVLPMGKAPLMKVTFKNGYSVKCDNRHNFKVLSDKLEWKNILSLKEGDMVATPYGEQHFGQYNARNLDIYRGRNICERRFDYNLLFYLSGFLLSRGEIIDEGEKTHIKIRFTTSLLSSRVITLEEKVRNVLVKSLLENGILFTCESRRRDVGTSPHSVVDLIITDQQLLKVFLREFDVRSGKVPEHIYKSVHPLRRLFLKGLVEGGGQLDGNKVILTFSERNLAEEIAFLLTSGGFVFEVKNSPKLSLYQITIQHKHAFLAWIGIFSGSFYNRTKKKCPDVYIKEFFEKFTRNARGRVTPGITRQSYRYKELLEKRPEKCHLHFLYKMARDFGIVFDEKYDYLIVDKIEYLGEEQEMYTLSVDDDLHQFVADGVIAKNSAADIVSIAMRNIRLKLMETGDWWKNCQLLIQVHDELNFLIKETEIERLVPLIKSEMESAVKLRIPLVVDYLVGVNWFECK